MATEQAARAQYAEAQKARQHARDQYHARMKGNPTPSQEENDLIKLGAPMVNKKATGAGPDFGKASSRSPVRSPRLR
jgi:hypothetical protein